MKYMNRVRNIIIAIPHPSLAEGLKKMVETKGFKVIEIVVVLDHLVETVAKHTYEGITIDGLILSTDLARKQDDKRLELLSDTVISLRKRYHQLHFVVLADQKPGHPLLAELTSMGIYSIFLRGESGSNLDLDQVLATFDTPMPFTTEYTENVDPSIPWRKFYKGASPIEIQVKSDSSSADVKEELAKEPKVKEIVREKVVEVIKYVEVALPSTFCVFLSLGARAGTTFLSSNLAVEIALRDISCSYYELPTNRPAIFDHLKVWKQEKSYLPGVPQIEKNGFIAKENILSYSGVNWFINHPNHPVGQPSYEILVRLLNQSRNSTVTILDISNAAENEWIHHILAEATHIFLIVDPDPVLLERIAPNSTSGEGTETPEHLLIQRLAELKRHAKTTVNIIVNKMNDGVDKKFLADLLPIQPIAFVPHFAPEDVYRSLWEGKLFSEVTTDLDQHLLPVMTKILPLKLKARSKPKSIIKFFSRKKK
ncbi:hypothetical protein [Brevibacillus choshinensis]|uniref:hypothetical protein n=1 Tax=Brevibacillus choshinensis TaxID=54911 RepID=UPI002E2389D7|nr:hypothetical protein [Brevibacillus choshinensis]